MIKKAPKSESDQQAVERLFRSQFEQGYKLEAIHRYTDISGRVIYSRVRLTHPNHDKYIRPIYLNATNEYELGEPPELNAKSKPLYAQQLLKHHPEADVFVVEGEKICDVMNTFFVTHQAPFIAITSGGATSAEKADWSPLKGRNCTLWPDNDISGLSYIQSVQAKLHALAANVKVIDIHSLNLPEKGDFIDWFEINRDVTIENLLSLPLVKNLYPIKTSLIAVSLSQFLEMKLRPRENILDPWLPKAGLCMVYAARGVGKTYFALEIAMACSYGDKYLSFSAPKPIRVLYIDGEMPANSMQERLAQIEARKSPNSDMIQPLFLTPDLQPSFMPNLSTIEGQAIIYEHVKNCDLVIIDNISTLCNAGNENEAESWLLIQGWALQLRRLGISVLFIHHAGKSGQQRGTSKREDILDTVIKLKHPSDYEYSMGACFELHFEKARGIVGDGAMPIRCQLKENGWGYETLEISNYQKVVDLYNSGLPQCNISQELSLSKGQVSKYVSKAKGLGLITCA